jgi:hypothetical protein
VVTDVHQLAVTELSSDGERRAAEAPTMYGRRRSGVQVTRSTGTNDAS